MKKRVYLLSSFLALAAVFARAEESALQGTGDQDSAAPAAQSKAPGSAETPAAPPSEESLDVTITGEAKDEIEVKKDPPSLDVPFPEVAPLAREGQTERILAEEVQHMSTDDQLKLVQFTSRQTASPAMVRLPAAPFFRMEIPQGVAPLFAFAPESGRNAQWEFQVLDQNNTILKTSQGAMFPQKLLEWDGFENGAMKLKIGPAYTPKLMITDTDGKQQQFYGDPVQLDVMQYTQDGLFHIELSNDRLYERGSAGFAPEMELVLRAALDMLRLRVGTPLRVIVYESPSAGGVAKKRVERWKKFLEEHLMISSEEMTVLTMPPADRGKVTALMMLEKP